MGARSARAQAYGWSVAFGIVTPAEAVAWIDDQLASEVQPSELLLDASMSTGDPPGLIHALNALGAGTDLALTAKLVLSDLHRAVVRETVTPRAAARILYQMTGHGLVPDDAALHDMHWLEDAYCLGEQGTLEIKPSQTDREVRAFLERLAQGGPP